MESLKRVAPLILTVAPNGARRGKADHPHLPLTAAELAREAALCRDAGVAMIHIHVRDRDGRHSLDADAYRNAIAAVRREAGPDLLIQITTEAVGIHSPEAQMAVVGEVAPEAVSIAIREILPNPALEPVVARFLAAEARRGALIQYILYDLQDLAAFDALLDRGIIPAQGAAQLFVLGRYAGGQAGAPIDLPPLLSRRANALPWGVCAFGGREAACAVTAAALGGHARVGFENNLLLPDGAMAPDNAALVAVVAQAAQAIGLAIATPDQARRLFAGA